MAKYLVIVESPAKVKTIKNFWVQIMKSWLPMGMSGTCLKASLALM